MLLAQSPPPRQARAEQIKAALGLTDDQISQLVQLRRQERESLRTTVQQMREKRRTLQESLKAGGADPATLGNLLLDVQKLRQQVRDTNEQYRVRALGLLDDAQRTKLQSLEEAARLQPAIRQAVGLNLLSPPNNRSANLGVQRLGARNLRGIRPQGRRPLGRLR
jgi:Spy/CpxP family protein refolding chaperone